MDLCKKEHTHTYTQRTFEFRSVMKDDGENIKPTIVLYDAMNVAVSMKNKTTM